MAFFFLHNFIFYIYVWQLYISYNLSFVCSGPLNNSIKCDPINYQFDLWLRDHIWGSLIFGTGYFIHRNGSFLCIEFQPISFMKEVDNNQNIFLSFVNIYNFKINAWYCFILYVDNLCLGQKFLQIFLHLWYKLKYDVFIFFNFGTGYFIQISSKLGNPISPFQWPLTINFYTLTE